MNDFDMFKQYRLKSKDTDMLIISELTSQISYMNDISDTNFNNACEIKGEGSNLSNYWLGFSSMTSEMLAVMESDREVEMDDKRRSRMRGMLDACNVVLKMIEDEEFHCHKGD